MDSPTRTTGVWQPVRFPRAEAPPTPSQTWSPKKRLAASHAGSLGRVGSLGHFCRFHLLYCERPAWSAMTARKRRLTISASPTCRAAATPTANSPPWSFMVAPLRRSTPTPGQPACGGCRHDDRGTPDGRGAAGTSMKAHTTKSLPNQYASALIRPAAMASWTLIGQRGHRSAVRQAGLRGTLLPGGVVAASK